MRSIVPYRELERRKALKDQSETFVGKQVLIELHSGTKIVGNIIAVRESHITLDTATVSVDAIALVSLLPSLGEDQRGLAVRR